MEEGSMSVALIKKTLSYHGLPLVKIWEGERGETDLAKLGINNPDFSVYQSRQKNLTFQDRAKRLKLHQFISKNASHLYNESLVANKSEVIVIEDEPKKDIQIQLPLLEALLPPDKIARTKHFFEHIRTKDLVFGTIMSKSSPGYILKIACTTGSMDRYVLDLAIRGYLPYSNTYSDDKKSVNRSLTNGNTVCCEVQEVSPDTEKLVLEMKGTTRIIGDKEYTTGVTSTDNFPTFYKITSEKKQLSFEEILQSSPSFNNPFCEELLQASVGLSAQEHYSLMSSLRGRFPQQEYSNELRQVQASKWAFRSVAEGIEYFKVGKHTEAFQCLNKALNIDPRNVEGLVARGALYANSGSFKKAVEDFETALKLNPSHTNARKYMGETLVALGRSYEDENKIEEARKAYQDCLVIIPHHEEALNSLEYLKDKSQKSSMLFEPTELELPALNFSTKSTGERKLDDALAAKKEKRVKKKKPKAKSSKKYSSSSGSSSSSSESSDSESESSSDSDSSSSTGSDESHGKRKKSSSKKKREKSMSPLSKRMALMSANAVAAATAVATGESSSTSYQFNQPFMGSDSVPPAPPPPPAVDDYELKVRQFLEMTRDEDNYEERVRKFVEEASKYRKERKMLDDKNRKKKKKEGKKAKKESRKKRKEKEEKLKKKSGKRDKLELDELENKKLREALKIFEKLPVLDELGSKLSSIYGKATGNEVKLEEEKQKMKRFTPEKEYPEGKWKMIFTKDQKREMKPSTSKGGGFPSSSSKQLPFAADSDDSDRDNNTSLASSSNAHHRQQQMHHDDRRRASPHVPKKPEPSKPKPVVLDKFGNFRLANVSERTSPPRGAMRKSRSRSKSRKYSSSSKSRSRSPRRRRSRSVSYGKRRYSRSTSRSYRSRNRTHSRSRSKSYSRSRSRSVDRHRYDRRNFRGGYDRERGSTFYKTRFNPRGGYRGRGGNGGFRDNRDFRGRGRDRPFRARGGRGNPRYNSRGEHCDRRYDRDDSWDLRPAIVRRSSNSNEAIEDTDSPDSFEQGSLIINETQSDLVEKGVWRRGSKRAVPTEDNIFLHFEIPAAKILPTEVDNTNCKKYVNYEICVTQLGLPTPDPQPATIERRYTNFLALYNGLRKDHPNQMQNVFFPKKRLMGNFSPDLIAERGAAFEVFLDAVVSSWELKESQHFLNFLQSIELERACRLLDERRNEQAVPILQNSFRLLNKIYLDHSKAVLLILCRLVAACTTSPLPHPSAEQWAELALRRYESVCDTDLLSLYVPLLQTCTHLWWQRGRDNKLIDERLKDLEKKGIKTKGTPTLTQAIHTLDPRAETT
ncbi:sorting nexin-20 [Sergentomyia squamirostris]